MLRANASTSRLCGDDFNGVLEHRVDGLMHKTTQRDFAERSAVSE